MLLYRQCVLMFLLCGLACAAGIHIERDSQRQSHTILSFIPTKDTITAYSFNDARYRLMVIDEGDDEHRFGDLKSALTQNSCVAGVNGGFFKDDHNLSPMGLLISRGCMISPLAQQGFTASGVLYDTGHEIKLERRQKLSTPLHQMQCAVQSGPFLVENKKVVSGLNNKRRDRRTFVATDGLGNWVIGISSALTLRELAEWLASSPQQLGIEIRHALNLDGGSSSAFADTESGYYRPSVKRVRNYLGIFPARGSDKSH